MRHHRDATVKLGEETEFLGVKYLAVEPENLEYPCMGCAAGEDDMVCASLPRCFASARSGGDDVIYKKKVTVDVFIPLEPGVHLIAQMPIGRKD